MKNIINYSKILIATATFLVGLLIIGGSADTANAQSCSLSAGSGDVLVYFGNSLRSDNGSKYIQTVNSNIPAGKYKVTVVTWDGHSTGKHETQPNEQVYLALQNSNGSIIATTGHTNDIPDNQDTMVTVVASSLNVGSTATKVSAVHPAYPNSNPNSVTPVCALFDKIEDPVTPPPTNPLNLSCTVNASSVNVGQSVTFYANATGGSGNYTYSWSGAVSGSGSSRSTTFNNPGSYTSSVIVTDSSGNQKSANCPTVVVNQTQNNSLDATCTVSSTSVNVGQSVTFYANATGGSGNYTYSWSGAVSGSGSSRSTTFNSNGSYTAVVTVSDGSGNQVSRNCPTVYVNTNYNQDFSVECRVDDTSVDVGDRVTFTAYTYGGTSPYEYRWRGDTEGEDDDEYRIRVRYDDDGRYEVRVTVTDRNGNRASDDCPVVRVRDDGSSVTVRTNTTPTGQLAGLDSVFLNQVPYTGPAEDMKKIAGFMSLLVLWSLAIGLVFYSRHKKQIRSAQIARFKEMNRSQN